MTNQYILPLADRQAILTNVGGKGASLAHLVTANLPVPDGFHVTTAAYRHFVAQNRLEPGIQAALESVDVNQPATLETASTTIRELFAGAQTPPEVASEIAKAFAELTGQNPAITGESLSDSPKLPATPVAVRSSATAQDLPEASFAGQQDTFLNIQGQSEVLSAVKRCWASLWTARAIGYRARQNIGTEGLSLAVVVQTLVRADAAGILFTANPVNGRRDQAMISASWGLGEAVVGGLVTPDSIIVDKNSGQVLQRQTADKQVMTVRVNGRTEEQATPQELRHAPVLDDEQAAQLTRIGTQIETLYNMPMDIEWTLAKGKFAIVQARPITALPELELEPPTEWPMPNPKGKYVRASIIDLMPDPVSPLFTTIAFDAYDVGLTRAMSDITRSKAVLPSHFVTINDYVYSDTSFNARQLWWVLTRMLPAFPRMMRNGLPYWREHGRAPYIETIEHWERQSPADLSTTDLLHGAREIAKAAMFSLTAQMLWMGACAGSEMLFTRVYDKLVKRNGEPDATTFLMGYNSIPIRAEKSLYDLAAWCREHQALTAHILNTPSKQLVTQLDSDQIPTSVTAEDWQTFHTDFGAHVQQYGHIIYDLDFAKPLPLDDPAPMLETVKLFLRGQGANPHERQGSLEARRIQAAEAVLSRIKALKRWAYRTTLRWAQTLAEAREDALADIGLGYPALRRLLRELGKRLVEVRTLEHADDVFWLQLNELEPAVAALERGEKVPKMADLIRERQAFSRAAKRVIPPPVLPTSVKKVMGFSIEGMVAAGESDHTSDTIKGEGTSAGQVTAAACVLHGPEDFDQMQSGCVLVASTTTPAWTPLFVMAAAVVTDIGGPLSHGSIVAREYGIPAVMGTGVATRRIHSGQVITVDGSAGQVTLAQT